jgi:hypothetical protein
VLGLDLLGSAEAHNESNPEMRGTSILVNSQFPPPFDGKKLKISTGKNTFKSWAKIVDCGDVRMTFLDNTIALKQLEKAHQVSTSYFLSEKSLITVDYFRTAIIYSRERSYSSHRCLGWGSYNYSRSTPFHVQQIRCCIRHPFRQSSGYLGSESPGWRYFFLRVSRYDGNRSILTVN